jgi:PAS domain S-box-containing protein
LGTGDRQFNPASTVESCTAEKTSSVGVSADADFYLARHHSAIVASSDDAIVSKTAEGIITSFNPGAERLYGYKAHEVIGKHISLLLPQNRVDEFPSLMARLERGERIEHYETVRRRKDGTLIDVSVTISPLFDSSGRLVGASKIGRDITNRRQFERALTASENRFRELADAMPQIVWSATPDGRTDYYNRRWYEYTGITCGLVEQDLSGVVHADDARAAKDCWGRCVATGENFQIECRLRHASTGEYRWHLVRAEPVRDDAGQIIRWFGTSTDIHDQKRTSEQLLERTNELEILNRTAAMMAAERDLANVVQIVTDAGTQLSGAQFGAFFYNVVSSKGESYTLYALSGAPREAFSKFPMPRNTAVFGPTFGGQGIVRSDDITKDPRYGLNAPYAGMPAGHLPVRSYMAVSVMSRAGEVLGGLFFGHEKAGVFTEQAERALSALATKAAISIENARLYDKLQENQQQLTLITDSLPVLVSYIDADRRYQFNNKTYYDWFGHDIATMTGRTMQEVLGDDGYEKVRPYVERVLGGEPVKFEALIPYARGGARHVECSYFPDADLTGRVRGFYVMVNDVSERKRAEAELLSHRGRLEELVTQRTSELQESHERLRFSERMAALGTLSAGLGHDMGNLLLPLRLRIDSMLTKGVPVDTKDDLEAIRKCAEYLQRLANGLRLFALDPDKSDTTADRTDLHEWWPDVFSFFKNALPRHVVLEQRFAPDLPPVRVAKPNLTQALFNLVQNAGDVLRNRPSGRVVIWAEPGAEPQTIRLGVSDEGPGMKPEVRRRCLEPFYTTKTRGISTGLGLALVHGIVQKAEGKIEIETELDRGTTFAITHLRNHPADRPVDRPKLWSGSPTGDNYVE